MYSQGGGDFPWLSSSCLTKDNVHRPRSSQKLGEVEFRITRDATIEGDMLEMRKKLIGLAAFLVR